MPVMPGDVRYDVMQGAYGDFDLIEVSMRVTMLANEEIPEEKIRAGAEKLISVLKECQAEGTLNAYNRMQKEYHAIQRKFEEATAEGRNY